jgi:hypothetical protein
MLARKSKADALRWMIDAVPGWNVCTDRHEETVRTWPK